MFHVKYNNNDCSLYDVVGVNFPNCTYTKVSYRGVVILKRLKNFFLKSDVLPLSIVKNKNLALSLD